MKLWSKRKGTRQEMGGFDCDFILEDMTDMQENDDIQRNNA